tara:strand:+ start:56 stop:496 length:441 start_codon:yes stop_codon:yes gene_type:complete
MKKLTLLVASLMMATFTFAQQGSMSFAANSLDITKPLDTDANIGYYMTDDIMVSLGMSDWDNFEVGARYYGICDGMFIQAMTTATTRGEDEAGNEIILEESNYNIGAAIGWTLDTGFWKFQFEPMIVLDDIQDFTPRLAWALRFTL